MDLGCGGVEYEGEIMFRYRLDELMWTTTRPDLLVHAADPSILGYIRTLALL